MDLDSFEGWRKHHGYDGEASEEIIEGWRADFAADLARREAARAAVFFSKPPPAGEYRYAVAVEDGMEWRLALVVSRRFKRDKGVWECFILMQRDKNPDPREPDWEPHASYHWDGTYHQKSYGQKFMVQQRQALDRFKGSEHLGSFQGIGLAICNSANFTDVLRVPEGVLTSMRGSVLIDLVEPGVLPETHHRQIPGQTIADERTYTDCSPSVVIAIAKHELP